MQIEIKLDESCKEPKIIVLTDKITDEISAILGKLSEGAPRMIAGFQENNVEILEQADIIRVYSAAGKVFAVTHHDTRSAFGFMNWRSGWTRAFLPGFPTLKLSI